MRQTHNILLVTNDHVETLTKMADNTITVSAIDRKIVKVNDNKSVDREKVIHALSVGDEYVYNATNDDLKFFVDVEIVKNGGIMGVVGFTAFAFLLFLISFWDSSDESAALVLIAGGVRSRNKCSNDVVFNPFQLIFILNRANRFSHFILQIIAYFAINPYLLSLVDWRNYMNEEAEALLHSSKSMNKALKSSVTMTLIFAISLVEFGLVNAVVGGLSDFKFWIAILFDSGSMTFPFLCFGLYTGLPHQAVETLSSMPFLFMIFFSTTFSPGAGVPVLKELRYLFSRFYFWCMVPGVQDMMEGCPADERLNVLYLCLSGLLGVVLFFAYQAVLTSIRNAKKAQASKLRETMMEDDEFIQLQVEMYGEKQLRRLQHIDSSGSLANSVQSNNKAADVTTRTTIYSDHDFADLENVGLEIDC